MATRMQQRRSPASDWSTANPILAAGEIGYEIDTNKFKIGDGINHWANLTYFTSAVEIQNLIDGAPDLLNTLNELAASIGDDPAFFTTVATNLSNHESDTTNIHGIADTAALATKTYADNAASAAETTAKGYADTAIANLVDAAPTTLNTLNELAAALGHDANYATTITTALGLKAPLASPELTGIPTAPTATAGTNTTQVSTTAFVKTAIDALSTSDIEEQTNLYFTDQRAVDAVVYAINHGLDVTLDGGTL